MECGVFTCLHVSGAHTFSTAHELLLVCKWCWDMLKQDAAEGAESVSARQQMPNGICLQCPIKGLQSWCRYLKVVSCSLVCPNRSMRCMKSLVYLILTTFWKLYALGSCEATHAVGLSHSFTSPSKRPSLHTSPTSLSLVASLCCWETSLACLEGPSLCGRIPASKMMMMMMMMMMISMVINGY